MQEEPTKPRLTETRERVLQTAEELFAKRGFEAVSIRDITRQCGANVASINYHFGGRTKLISEVMMRHVQPVNEERLARLDSARQKWGNKQIPVEELIEAWVRPLITRVKKSHLPDRLFYQLCGRIFSQHGEGLPSEVEAHWIPVWQRFFKFFSASLPQLDAEELAWRMHFTMGGMIHLLGHQDALERHLPDVSGNPTIEISLSRLIRYASAGFREGIPELGAHEKKAGPQGFFDF